LDFLPNKKRAIGLVAAGIWTFLFQSKFEWLTPQIFAMGCTAIGTFFGLAINAKVNRKE